MRMTDSGADLDAEWLTNCFQLRQRLVRRIFSQTAGAIRLHLFFI
jgi:hypothetical protein